MIDQSSVSAIKKQVYIKPSPLYLDKCILLIKRGLLTDTLKIIHLQEQGLSSALFGLYLSMCTKKVLFGF
jgi:hypothetical protein